MKSKKAQVSLEYLSTYSWAIIILLTIVSTLAYFGFFNDRTYVETSCISGDFLFCEDGTLIDDGNEVIVQLKLRNNMNDDIKLEGDLEIIEYPGATCDALWSGEVIERGQLWTSGECRFTADFEEGDIEEISFYLTYSRNEPGSTEHFINGGLKTIVVRR